MTARFSILAVAVGVGVTLATLLSGAGLSASADLQWTGYGGSASSSRYFDSKEITKANVGKLEPVWSYPYGEAGFHPVIVHNMVYFRGRNGALIALDAKNGKELWILEDTLGHELTHVSLHHLSMPQWLEEGLAQMFEHNMTGRSLLGT